MSRRNYAKGRVVGSRSNNKIRCKKIGQTTIFGLESPIQTPILDRLGNVRRLDFFGAFQVGDGAADLQDAAVGAGA